MIFWAWMAPLMYHLLSINYLKPNMSHFISINYEGPPWITKIFHYSGNSKDLEVTSRSQGQGPTTFFIIQHWVKTYLTGRWLHDLIQLLFAQARLSCILCHYQEFFMTYKSMDFPDSYVFPQVHIAYNCHLDQSS